MVKESKKKAKSGKIEELEIEIESNELEDLNNSEKELLREMSREMKNVLAKSAILEKTNLDEIETFARFAIQGAIKVFDFIMLKTS